MQNSLAGCIEPKFHSQWLRTGTDNVLSVLSGFCSVLCNDNHITMTTTALCTGLSPCVSGHQHLSATNKDTITHYTNICTWTTSYHYRFLPL